jgi:8-hydroxy-5-deazaflavin:NADPH oxidoreductase
MAAALAAADAARSPKRRDLSFEAVMERLSGSGKTNPDAEYVVRLNRALYM